MKKTINGLLIICGMGCASLLGLAAIATSCTTENEDLVKECPKNGSIEVQMSTNHINKDKDLLTCTYKVWKNGKIEKSIIITDTISGLGEIKAESEEDENGNVKSIMVPKDYEFYVTVK